MGGNNKEPWSKCFSALRNSNDNCTSSNRTVNPTPTTTRSSSHNNRICIIARWKTAETNTSVDRISILVAEQRFFHDLILYKILPLLLLLHVMYYYNQMLTRK